MNQSPLTPQSKFAFYTKDALSKGILWKQVEPASLGCYWISGKLFASVHQKFVHDSYESALTHANSLRERKINSLKRQISKLNSLQFSDPTKEIS